MFEDIHGSAILVGSPLGTGYYVGSDNARTLRKGMKGDDVRALQTALTAAGFDTKGADGAFGANTEAAVRSYQKTWKLTVDGIAGPNTLTLLGLPAPTSSSPAATGGAGPTAEASVTSPPSGPPSFLKQHWGPLPVWGWGCIAAAAALAGYAVWPKRA